MTRFSWFKRGAWALTSAGVLALSACTTATDTAKDAAGTVAETAKDAATATGQAALTPAVNPVLDLLKKGEADVKAGNLAGAAATMGGFQGIWEKAGPVIQPLAGDKWGAVDGAAKMVISTFGSGAKPDAAAASKAITGLMGPLKGLIGQ